MDVTVGSMNLSNQLFLQVSEWSEEYVEFAVFKIKYLDVTQISVEYRLHVVYNFLF